MIDINSLGGLGAVLGDGGQGTVHQVPAHPDLLVKTYKPNIAVDPQGLDALVTWRARLAPADRAVIDGRTAWPSEVVDLGGGEFGIAMRRAPQRFFFDLGLGDQPRSLAFGYDAQLCQFNNLSPASARTAVGIVTETLKVFEVFERTGVTYGDLSGRNLLWAGGTSADVILIDCDAAEIAGEPRAVSGGETPLWECPHPHLTGPARDHYKLGLLFLRIYWHYMGVIEQSTNAIPMPADPPVSRAAADLLARSLSPSRGKPTPSEWLAELAQLDSGLRTRRIR